MNGPPSRAWIRYGAGRAMLAIALVACGHLGAGGDGVRNIGSGAISPDSQSIDEGQVASWSGSMVLGLGTAGMPSRVGWDFEGDGTLDEEACDSDPATPAPDCRSACEPLRSGTLPVGNVGLFLTVADFNGDGRPDLATSNLWSGTVSIFLDAGADAFVAMPEVFVGANPRWIAPADFDGDGNLDFGVSTGAGSVSTELGDGAGGFTRIADVPVGSRTYFPIAAADLDGDGRPDLIAGGPSGTIELLLGDGAGGFAPPVSVASGAGLAMALAVADFNDDGAADVAVAATGVTVLLGDGQGGFLPAAWSVASPSNSLWLGAARIDTDGNPDLVVADYAGHAVDIFGGDGSGSFGPATVLPSGIVGPSQVVTADLDGDGIIDLAAGSLDINVLSFWHGLGGGSFAPRIDYNSAGFFAFLAAADFDGDGVPDLMAEDWRRLSIFQRSVAGGFAAIVEKTGGGELNASGAVLGNANADGHLDLIVFTPLASGAHVLLGDGTGGFGPPTAYGGGGMVGPSSAGTADLNGDGLPDLLLVDAKLSVLLGNGSGFGPPTSYGLAAPTSGLATGDFNRDGFVDAAVTRSNMVSILLGTGTGAFGAPTDFATGAGPSAIVAADLDGDGLLDLAITNSTASTVSFLHGNGGGTFATYVEFPVGGSPEALAVADVDGDGDLDLATGNGDGSVSVLLGDGGGAFANRHDYPSLYGTTAVSFGDFDGDGRIDLVSVDGFNAFVRLGEGDGTFESARLYYIGGARGLATSDLDGDGRDDMVVAGTVTDGAGYQKGFSGVLLGGQAFRQVPVGQEYMTGPYPLAIAAADVGGSPAIDLVTANSDGDSVTVLSGDGAGGFVAMADVPAGDTPTALAIADLDGDGSKDLAITDQRSSAVSILLGDGSGGWRPRVEYPTGASPRSVAVGDLDGDGRLDLAVADSGSNAVSVLLGTGGGAFGTKTDYAAAASPLSVAIGDIDEDGQPDLALASVSGAVSLFRNSGGGGFAARTDYAFASPDALSLADLDNDGHLDLVVSDVNRNGPGAELEIRYGTGTGGFGLPVAHALGYGGFAVTVADFDQDGIPDIAAGSDQVAVFSGAGGRKLESRLDRQTDAIPSGLAVADFNGDGIPDVAAAMGYLRSVAVFLGPLDDSAVACPVPASHVYTDSKGGGTGPSYTWRATLRADCALRPAAETHPVTVRNIAPAIESPAVPAVGEGESSILDLAWTDPGTNDAFQVQLDWGDGASDVLSRPVGAFSAMVSHAYANGGSYPVTGTVVDDEGGASVPVSLMAVVQDVPAAITSVATNAPVPAGSAARVTITATPASGDRLVYDFDWDGDGSFLGPDDVLGSTSNTSAFTRGTSADVTVHVRVRDDDGNSAAGQVEVDWQPTLATDHAPVAVADAFSTDENVELQIPVPALLANDSDPDAGDVISFVSASQPAHGSVLVGGGIVRYSPAASYHGSDAFYYTIADSLGVTATAQVTVDVAQVNQPPAVGLDSVSTMQGFPLTIASNVLLANDTDADADPLSIASVAIATTDGSVALSGSNVVFTPAPWFHGITTFTDVVSDGTHSVSGTVVVTVLAVEHGPGMPGISSPVPGTSVSQNPPALVIIDAVDLDGDPLSYDFQISTSADFQGADLEDSGLVSAGTQMTAWTPAGLLENTTYHWRARATDGAIDGPWASSTFFVDGANDPPGSPLPVSPADGSVLETTQPALTVLDALDPEGDALSYEIELRRDGALVFDSAGIAETAVATSFQPADGLRAGDYAWKARAIDGRGGVGAWSAVVTFRIASTRGGGRGCGCDLSAGSTGVEPSLSFILGVMILVLMRRRRRDWIRPGAGVRGADGAGDGVRR